MRSLRLAVALVSAAAFAAACTSGRGVEPTSPPVDTRPLADAPPYLCDLVPQEAFRIVSGVAESIRQQKSGTDRNGLCSMRDVAPHPLVVSWMGQGGATLEHLHFVADDLLAVYERHDGVRLPMELGTGMAAYVPDHGSLTEQSYQVAAKFRCDGEEQLLTLRLDQVAEGRDAMGDLIALMRIAQRRYGEVHGCVPGT
ncbi:hypothetical protein [Microtetraspora malaysiensis]|uniref:hypothetical protein n=1 Tax=Microtetraspora malaysiensis TaxID=161358 RepID=UPI003D89BF18